jgi:hypothetical protein
MTMAEEMWALIPAIYRRRDADAGNVLRALIEVFGEQAELIRDDIAELYDNWFIETCDDWVVPYIGDLTGAMPLVPTGDPPTQAEAAKMAQVAPPRLLVANAIRLRRRKGCFSIIAQLAHDVALYPAYAVEFGKRLTINYDARDPFARGFTTALRDPRPLAHLDTPDDPAARSVDVRDASAPRAPGRYGPANIGVFLFTPLICGIANGDAFCVDEEGSASFCFDAFGRDTPLYHPAPAAGGLPGPISRDRLGSRRPDTDPHPGWDVDPALYGPLGCTMIWVQMREGGPFSPVEPATIMPADLTGWREQPPAGFVALDPERGRIAFPRRAAPRRVRVTYDYAIPAAIGGGDYPRPASPKAVDPVYVVTASQEEGHNSLRSAVEQWRDHGKPNAVIEFRDSLTYDEDRLTIDLSGMGESSGTGDVSGTGGISGIGRRLVIRAAPRTRPVIRLSNYEAGAADAWRILGDGAPGASLVLEGLAVGGRGIAVTGYGGDFELRHCTLFPGWLPASERGRRHAEAPSLSFVNCTGPATIRSSIIGPVFVQADEQVEDPLRVCLADSILDAGGGNNAFLSPDAVPYVALSIHRCTVLGAAAVHAIPLAENSVFTGRLAVARRGEGCIRFCALPLDSRTPRRVECVPRAGEDPALRPVFVSQAYGSVGYAMLAPGCPEAIARGADDRSEMGVYHDLFRPQRDTNLRAALAEYLPAGISAGIIYVS